MRTPADCHSRASRPAVRQAVWFILAAVLLLSGCVTLPDLEAAQEQRSHVLSVVNSGQEFRQELRPRRAGLTTVSAWLGAAPETPPEEARLAVALYRASDDQPVASRSYRLSDLAQGGTVELSFAPQPDAAKQSYTLVLRPLAGQISVQGEGADVYPEGEARLDGQPVPGDAAFSLAYRYGWGSLQEDLQAVAQRGWLVLPLGLALLLPGWLALELSGLKKRFDPGERLALAAGLSLALLPLGLTWSSLFGLAWSPTGIRIVFGLLAVAAAGRAAWTSYRARQAAYASPDPEAPPSPKDNTRGIDGVTLALAAVLVSALIVRLLMVRDLAAAPWVDSVHHALITRLILAGGGLPDSYAPYLELATASYHPGFHSALAVYQWLSGEELAPGMLLFGQALNILAVLAVYPFTTSLTGNRRAGALAALIAGLITPMPAYYTSWGRYTQLAGLVILPAGMALFKRLLEAEEPAQRRRAMLLVGIAGAGLFLTHYRVASFFGLLVLLVLAASALRRRQTPGVLPRLRGNLGYLAGAGLVGFVLAAPWLPETFATLLAPKFAAWQGGAAQPFGDFSWSYLNSALGKYSLGLAGLGFLWGLARRRAFPLLLLTWAGLLFGLANLNVLGWPGSGFVNNTSVEISLYLPLAALGSFPLADLLGLWERALAERPAWTRGVLWGAAWIAGAAAVVLGGRALAPLLNPVTFLYRQADGPALSWAAENLPPDATLLVNPFAWGYGLYAGNDGGYWGAALAQLPTLPPPVLYGLGNQPEAIEQVNELSQFIIDHGNDPAGLAGRLREEEISYIFIGRRGGALDAAALLASPDYSALYAQGGVWILQVNPP